VYPLLFAEHAVAVQRTSVAAPQQVPKANRPKTIGAKPQYNTTGLMAAVQQISVSASNFSQPSSSFSLWHHWAL